MVIGITGGSGTGKSLLARLLGYRTVDADAVYRSLLDSCAELRSELTAAFGSCERGPISAAVFSCPKKLELLNKIT
ncbi:MAG: dephospho-CoA kinase, partial [Defluviitaleaceae bacterium]|nr:dephospho-CoA kinase [Defluviitaleaceae bacterium]